MPLEPNSKFFHGAEARGIWKATRNVFMDTLRDALNDEQGDYQPGLNTEVAVTSSEKLAADLYNQANDDAIIYVVRGKLDDSFWGKKIGGTFYEGKRYEIELLLDFSMGPNRSNPESPVDAAEADEDLADALCYFLKAHVSQFNALGLHNIEVEPDAEKQGAGIGRNPHRVTFLAFALDNYNP
jgi:hypothetical protein